jgi:hypothetical protein
MSGEASLVVKGVVYSLTIALLLYATYCEQKLKDYLIDEADQDTNVIDSGIIAEQFRRARVLGNVPREKKAGLRRIVIARFVFFLLLIVEVVIFQR